MHRKALTRSDTSGQSIGVGKKKAITLEAILEQDEAADAWTRLQQDVSEDDLERVKYLLEALANQISTFGLDPPDPRDARRFADHLLKQDVPKVRRLNLYFGSELPLGNHDVHDLPEILESYAGALERASKSRQKQRPTDQNQDHEIEIVRLLDRSIQGQERHHYAEAVVLIQAAYYAGDVNRMVDEGQLRKLYDRQSFRYRVEKRKV